MRPIFASLPDVYQRLPSGPMVIASGALGCPYRFMAWSALNVEAQRLGKIGGIGGLTAALSLLRAGFDL